MALRTVMIFPEFGERSEVIDTIRDRYDPLAGLVRPHITVVFPFDSPMSDDELSRILDERLRDVRPFDVLLKGFSKSTDPSGNYLFLDVLKGKEDIISLHELFYANEFREFYQLLPFSGISFVPHVTVGKVGSLKELDAAYDDIKDIDLEYGFKVKKISVEMIGPNEESIIIIEKELGE
ncbi:MAG: 2'-5' RNA ligase family protein [Clostridiales bacterium]|nr:2'-5' RNA ligase family protein [Clostridiales bacterium]